MYNICIEWRKFKGKNFAKTFCCCSQSQRLEILSDCDEIAIDLINNADSITYPIANPNVLEPCYKDITTNIQPIV